MEYLTRKKKSFKNWIIVLFFIIIAAILYTLYFVRSSLAPMDGELQLKNLSLPVSVIRDQFGIPHIKAKNTKDAFRALGFVVASERLFQMEMERRMANGELAEIFGKRMLAADKLFRTISLRQSMSEMLERKIRMNGLDQSMWGELEAFYDGVNQYQSSQKLPLEFSILGIKPRPFSALDGYAFIGLMSFSFGVATSEDPLMTKLRTRIGSELSNELRNELTPYETREIEKEKNGALKTKRVVEARDHYPVMKILSELEQGFPLFEGSNGWIVSGKRSSTGFPILANDPHIAYSHPGVWFEAHIDTPDYESYGHFLSILPFPILSHNKERGWGLTMSLIDDMDLYREKLNPKFKSYHFIDKEIPYQERLEVIKVKGEKSFEMLVLKTQHGPIMDEVFSNSEDKSLALKWAFYGVENDPLLTLYKMGRARNMEEFKSAVSSGKAPGLNVLYADKKNIGWWIFGEVEKKSSHTPSDFILDGSSGLDEYQGPLSFDQKPHLENPASGLIISANSRPFGAPLIPENMRGDWQPDDRYNSLDSILSKKDKWSVEEFKEIQTLSLNLENKLILDELLKTLAFQNIWKKERATTYLQILKKWNYVSDVHSIAPSLYYTWCREITKILLKDLSKEEFETFTKLPNNWNFLKRVVLNPNSSWWKKFDRQKVITTGFNNTIESLRQALGEDSAGWAWGHLHTIEFVHPIGSVTPFNKIFNIGPIEISGAYNEINNQKPSGYADGFKVKAGPSTRRIISFDHPEVAWGILPTGNSGHLLSPFYKNQVELFAKGLYREEWLNEKDIKAHQTHELNLVPAK
ncbi:MAG: penicillin acylase family protein [Bacteriovorax sp.]|nr:penicillin acylase family protein [Bacteriovorax sp.]